jgi:hypothetical protein
MFYIFFTVSICFKTLHPPPPPVVENRPGAAVGQSITNRQGDSKLAASQGEILDLKKFNKLNIF